jgi:putative zinc finger/helix-turn-helix YgiT family protein
MKVTYEDREYEDDLNVVIKDAEVRRCGDCDEEEIGFPAIEGMHKTIANALARKPGRLTPSEIRFLRTYLGHSSADFAGLMAVKPETVSRWERKDGRYPMKTSHERALRVLAILGGRVRSYRLEQTGIENRANDVLFLDESGGRWQPTPETA